MNKKIKKLSYSQQIILSFLSVILFGRIKEIEDLNEKVQKLRLLGNKYFPSEKYTEEEINKYLDRTLVLEMDIEHMTGRVVTEK